MKISVTSRSHKITRAELRKWLAALLPNRLAESFFAAVNPRLEAEAPHPCFQKVQA
jgi:hypothetical protein